MLLLEPSSLLSLRGFGSAHITLCPFSDLQRFCKNKVLVLQGIVPE